MNRHRYRREPEKQLYYVFKKWYWCLPAIKENDPQVNLRTKLIRVATNQPSNIQPSTPKNNIYRALQRPLLLRTKLDSRLTTLPILQVWNVANLNFHIQSLKFILNKVKSIRALCDFVACGKISLYAELTLVELWAHWIEVFCWGRMPNTWSSGCRGSAGSWAA